MELPINVKVIVRTLMSGEGIQKIGSYISSFFKEPLIKFKEFQASRAEKYLSEREAKISKEEEIRKSFLEREAKLIEYINKEILPFIQKLQMAKYLTEDQAKTSETILKALNTEKELKKTITDMDQAKTIAQKVQKEYYEKYVKQIIEEEKSQKRIQEIEQKRQEGYRRWLEQRRELKKLQEISETVRPIRELELREKRPIQRELISFGLPTKFVLGLVPGRTREDIEKLKYLSETYKDFLRSKFTEKEVELILKRLSSEKLENLRKQYFLGAEQASYFRTILREEKEKIKLEKQAIAEKERAKKEELKLQQQLKREKEKEIQIETSRQILIERISAYRADPRIRKFIEQQGELNEKSKEELQLILSKIYQLRTVEGILYRQRLEWDRIGNSLRFFGMILSGIWYSGIAAVRQFSVEVLKGQGALDLTQKQILSLKYTTGALGIQFDDLIQGIGNIYQALISAGQGTSFVAERVKEALDKVGISYYKLGEEMKPSYESFWQVIFALKELEVQFGRSWVAQKLLGTQFERFAPLLGLSTEDLKRLKSESEDFANRMVIDTDAIVKANVNLGKIIQELKLTYIKIFGDIVASSKSFFEKLKDITTSIAELWVKLPNGLKSFAAYALIYLGPGSFVLGSIVRFGDTLARIINSLPALVIGFKEVFVTISSLVLTHPILSGIVVLLTAIGGALSGLIERKRKQIDLEAQWREKAEEAYKSYAQTIQNLSKAIEQGFRPTKASITELKQSLLDLDKAMVKYYRGEIKKEELVKAFEVIKSKITPITQEYQDWLKTRRLTILTENDVKKILEETEIKIKENNLSLKEQFYIYDELSKRIIIENLNQETINQVLEKRASIIKEILGKFEELRKELTRSEGEIPFIKNYLDGLNKIKELEEYIPIIRQTKGIQETINAQKLLNDYRLRLQKIYHREFLEAESKNLSDIIDLNKQLGRFISKTYYQAKEVEAKRHTSELESIEQTYNQAILELTQKQSLDEIPKIEQLKNQEIEKEHKKHILNLLNLDKRLIDDRIDLMNKELEAYEIRLKDKEISEKELTDIYSQDK
ncbi:MAG TPA: hypothetical protein PKV21_03440, partial [bacterium]|nr:hypothetical protein [bacterium]